MKLIKNNMDILNQIKAKIEEMKAKYNQERDEEDFPNHSDGNGMYWSGVFSCLKEISFFIDHLEVKELDLEKELNNYGRNYPYVILAPRHQLLDCAKHFYELGLKT